MRARHLLLLAVGLLGLAARGAAAAVAVTFNAPAAGSLQAGTVGVQVTVSSTFELATVHAQVETVGLDLAPLTATTWAGTLTIGPLARGPKTIVVTATSVVGETGTASRPITHDDLPVITLVTPIDNEVARPTLHVVATCTDDDVAVGCVTMGVTDSTATGTTSLDTVVDLSARDGWRHGVTVFATDSTGRTGTAGGMVYVDGSPGLVDVAILGAAILDVDETRILYRDQDGVVKVYSRGTGAITAIGPQVPLPSAEVAGYLTSTGAAYGSRGATPLCLGDELEVYEWHGSGAPVLIDVSCTLGALGNWGIPAGDFAIRRAGFTVTRRNLATGATVDIMVPGGAGGTAVGPNGDVIATEDVPDKGVGTTRFTRWRAGVVTDLGSTPYTGLRNQLTDGVNVIFHKGIVGTAAHLALFTAAGEVDLNADRSSQFLPWSHYAVAGGWTAFVRAGPSGVFQVWRRSPAGVEEQLTPFSGSSTIDALAPTGHVTVIAPSPGTPGARYLGEPAAIPTRISSSYGHARFLPDGLYLAMGRHVFRYDLAVGPLIDAGVDAPLDAGVDAPIDAPADGSPGDGPIDDAVAQTDGPAADGAGTDGPAPASAEGCGGCAQSSPSSSAAAVIFALAALRRRRRTRA